MLFNDHLYIVRRIVGYFARKYHRFVNYDELYQWGLIGLWDACRRWKGDEHEFLHYVGRRIKGQIIDELRRHQLSSRRRGSTPARHRLFLDIDEVDPIRDGASLSDELVHTREVLNRLVGKLRVLTPKERQVFELHYISGLNAVEVAERIGISEPRVAQLKKNSITKLLRRTGMQRDECL